MPRPFFFHLYDIEITLNLQIYNCRTRKFNTLSVCCYYWMIHWIITLDYNQLLFQHSFLIDSTWNGFKLLKCTNYFNKWCILVYTKIWTLFEKMQSLHLGSKQQTSRVTVRERREEANEFKWRMREFQTHLIVTKEKLTNCSQTSFWY